MGKVIVEKLIRACPNVDRIYLIVRQKGQLSPKERVQSLLESEFFSLARKEVPNLAEKIIAIGGELGEENIGLSEEDLALLIDRVNILFHVAATVKFNEKLKIAVELNVVAVRRVLEFAKKLRNGVAFVHTSTAYAHTNRDCIEEVVYPACFDPYKLIEITEALDDTMADALTPGLVGTRPNTYTFTKSIAEALVAAEKPPMATAIIRPSIIGCAWKEPFAGWIDNFNGPSGLSLAAGTGVMRVMPGNKDMLADIIPVDTVANFAIVVPWFIAARAPLPVERHETRVFNLTSGGMNSCKWSVWVKSCIDSYSKYPLEKRTFRRPRLAFVPSNTWEFWFRRQFWHILPARITDLLILLQGKPPKMLKTFEKLDRAVEEYSFFTARGWKWETRNGEAMLASMSEADKQLFDFDLSKLHWPTYVENQCVGIKKFLMREDMARLDVALKGQRRMMLFNFLAKATGLLFLIRVVLPFLRRRGLLRSSWLLLAPALLMMKA